MKVLVNVTKASGQTSDLVQKSLLFRELKAEYEEILRHKWIESEKIGRDLGFDLAKIDWHLKHRSQWCKWRRTLRPPLNSES